MKFLLLCFILSVALADDLHAFTNANNKFTPSVYREIAKAKDGNFLVSPFSAEIILALVQSGGKDDTSQEIRTALHLPDDKFKVESDIKTILPTLTKNSTKNEYVLHTANKIYIKKDFTINDNFKQAAEEIYQSEIETVDFSKREEAANAMNEWVEDKTENKINNLIDWNTLDNNTRAVLINALYFRGTWSITFPPMLTQKANFYKDEQEGVQVDTMYLEDEDLLYYECPHLNAKFLELPFKGKHASMTIILPNKKEGLSSLENNIENVFKPHNLTREVVNVALPKFKVESQLDLNPILQNLGVYKVFDEDQADLSEIAGEKGDLIISAIIQKSFIDLNEQGVEAAAATFIPAIVSAMGIDEPKSFIVDHPFIFYIKVEGLILFSGKIVLPSL